VEAYFVCNNCKKEKLISFDITKDLPKNLSCDCGGKLNKSYSKQHIPSIKNVEGLGDDMYVALAEKMKHGTRPSGRSKIWW
jgi:hypothetical protein